MALSKTLLFSVWILVLIVVIVIFSFLYINNVYEQKMQEITTNTETFSSSKKMKKQKKEYFPSQYAIFYPDEQNLNMMANMPSAQAFSQMHMNPNSNMNQPMKPKPSNMNKNLAKTKKKMDQSIQQKLQMMNEPIY